MNLTEAQKKILLGIAHEAIESHLKNRRAVRKPLDAYPEEWHEHRATFVTLYVSGELRGCIGTLEPRDPLVVDIRHNAVAAATRDPRFDPIRQEELPQLAIHLSILNPPEPLPFTSEEDLLQKIRPGIDGLILECGSHRGTFLPAVWETLPTPEAFLRGLKRKAGLSEDFWSNQIVIKRYTTKTVP